MANVASLSARQNGSAQIDRLCLYQDRSDPPLLSTDNLVAKIFSGQAGSEPFQFGDGWQLKSVKRDVALCHALECGPFECALNGIAGAKDTAWGVRMVFIQKGSLSIQQWGRKTLLSDGDIFVCCGWIPLSVQCDEGLKALIIDVPSWWAIERFFDKRAVTQDMHIHNDYFASPVIHSLGQKLFDNVGSSESEAQGTEMLADLLKTALGAKTAEPQPLPRVEGRMGRIMQFIVTNIDKTGLSARDAAQALKCSPRTIYQACADQGTSFNAIMMELRLLSAQYHLMRSSEQVGQVAYSVGFSSVSHFSRLFKARFGSSPKAYRDRSQILSAQ